MKKIDLSDEIISVISDAKNRIHVQDGYVGEKTYRLGIYEAVEKGKKASYLTASDEDMLICVKDIRADLDKFTAEKAFEDLNRRLGSLFGSAEVSSVINPSEDADILEQPLLVRIAGGVFEEEKNKKAACAELNDWLDELSVMISAKVSKSQEQSLKNDYDKLMSGGKLAAIGEKEPKDYSSTMAMITLVLTILGGIFRDSLIFSVMGLMAGGFSAYRCFSNKNNKGLVICALCFIACIVFAYLGWQEIRSGIQSQLK